MRNVRGTKSEANQEKANKQNEHRRPYRRIDTPCSSKRKKKELKNECDDDECPTEEEILNADELGE